MVYGNPVPHSKNSEIWQNLMEKPKISPYYISKTEENKIRFGLNQIWSSLIK